MTVDIVNRPVNHDRTDDCGHENIKILNLDYLPKHIKHL